MGSCKEESSPNIIYILADDLGYGDVSAYNQDSKIHTLAIDRLAEEGMLFTDAHSNSSVCTPTRYGILTGRYSWRTWMKQGVLWSYDEPLIPNSRETVATLLKRSGYNTACIGKWHLGLGWERDEHGQVNHHTPLSATPNDIGFDYFYGITASLDIPPYFYIENREITATDIDSIHGTTGKGFWRKGPIGNDFRHEDVLPQLTQKAVSYIHDQAQTENPFFMYFPLPAPHTPILPTAKFKGSSLAGTYGDFTQMVDDFVKQITDALEKSGQTENTMVIFTSDNGCSPAADINELNAMGHDPSGGFRGMKADIFEGGHRVPFIVKWPEKIVNGSRYEYPVSLTDLFATVAELTMQPMRDNWGEDSVSILSVLSGKHQSGPIREATVHHSIDGVFAIRKHNWKLIFGPGSGGWSFPVPKKARMERMPLLQLYDLTNDPAEKNNVAVQHPDVVEELTALMHHYVDYGRSTPGNKQPNDTPVTFLPTPYPTDNQNVLK
jgi:arylsulfatase A